MISRYDIAELLMFGLNTSQSINVSTILQKTELTSWFSRDTVNQNIHIIPKMLDTNMTNKQQKK